MHGKPRYETAPIRLFKSDFLEFFSHVKPATVLVLWVPVAAFFLAQSVWYAPGYAAAAQAVGRLSIGWFVWTLVEYLMHRFFFHHHPKTENLKRVFFLVHGVHHAQPLCRTRLVMPPAISIPLGDTFYAVFHLVFDVVLGRPLWLAPVFGGFVVGYIVYDMMHYSLHHARVRGGYMAM